MTPLGLVALLAVGADPSPAPAGGPFCPPVAAHRRLPAGPVAKIRAAAEALQLVGKVPPGGPSYLYRPAYCEDFVLRPPAKPYQPQPGDIMLATDGSVFWTLMHNLAGTSHPTHSGVVFAMPGGGLGLLEGGPHDTLKCRILEPIPHMASYEAVGRVWVRRRTVPLTPCQSERLTEFALATDGRNFSLGKLAVQLTPLRSRGPVKTAFVGRPRGLAPEGYFCSELVCEALVYAGLLDPRTTRPGATYPRDLFFDASINPYINRHLKLYPAWDPPARWTGCPVVIEPRSEQGVP